MKVVHLTLPEKVEVKNIPARRVAEPKELLLEPIYVGLTGTDAMRFRKGAPSVEGFREPLIPGSEFVARVVGVGRSVDNDLVGQRVVANPVSPCLRCEWCQDGKPGLCPNTRMLGFPPVHGAMQQRLSWPAALCVCVPEEIPSDQAVLSIPLSVALHAVDLAQVPALSRVAVVGCGHLGLLLIKVLRALGVGDVLAVDLVEWRRRAALEHGATWALSPQEAMDFVQTWRRCGVEIAFDASNSSEGCRTAVSLTEVGGRTMITGIPSDNRVIFNALDARKKQLTVQFVRRPHDTLARAVELIRRGLVRDLDRIITHRFDLDHVLDAYRVMRHLKEEVIKVVIELPPYNPREESPERIYREESQAVAEVRQTQASH